MCDEIIINKDLLDEVLSSQMSLKQGYDKFCETNPLVDIKIREFALIVQNHMLLDIRTDSTEIKKKNIKYSKYALVNTELQKYTHDTDDDKSLSRNAWKNVITSGTELSMFLDEYDDVLGNSTESKLKSIKKAKRASDDAKSR
jgi:hypothetical protein